MFRDFPALRLPRYLLSRRTGRGCPLPLNFVVMSTYACNSRCRTCGIWRRDALNDIRNMLTADEYAKIFSGMGGRVWWLTIGGGEPFLRDDFARVAGLACRYLRPSLVNIPSNASLTERTAGAVDELCGANPGVHFIVNISVDHVGGEHDLIRGMEGGYSKALSTAKALRALGRANLQIGVHTVVSRFNAADFARVQEGVLADFSPDSYIIEDAQLRDEFANGADALLDECAKYAAAVSLYLGRARNSAAPRGVFDRLKAAFRAVYYADAVRSFSDPSVMGPCFAGTASCQLMPDGELCACGAKGRSLGNVREAGYDFGRLWNGERAAAVRREIRSGGCACRLSNAAYTNMLLSPTKLSRVLWRVLRAG